MSKRKRETPEEIRAFYREHGFPLVDQILLTQARTMDATDEQQRLHLLTLNCARDFTCDDPTVWAEAEAALTALRALRHEQAAGRIDDAAYTAHGSAILARCSVDVTLALHHLQRTALAAHIHVLQRGYSRN